MSEATFAREKKLSSPLAFVGSLCVHAGLAWLIITNLNSFGQQGDFGTSEDYREVGLYIIDDSAQEPEENQQPSEQTAEQLPPVPESLNASLNELPEMTQTLPELPALPRIGPGPTPNKSSNQSDEMISKASSRPVSPTKAGIPGVTTFMDIATSGKSLLYVIDCSGSMNQHNAFRHAKAELLSSLERLNSTHKFQLIFYNNGLIEFKSRQGKSEAQWATVSNLSRARAFINGMDNSGGTIHFPALLKALSYSPDVIFFLTDATVDTKLSPKQLDEIRRKNNGRAAIHCIEFAVGPDLKINNFLHELSRQNEGTYRRRDTTRFGK